MSWSVEVVAAIGEVEMAGSWGGGLVEMGMLEVFSGEVWKEEFLRMPGGSELYLAAVASRPSLALWLGKSGSLDNDRSGQRLGK